MTPPVDFLEISDGHQSVDLGAVDTVVPQQLLDVAHGSASLKKMSSEGVAKAMERDPRAGNNFGPVVLAHSVLERMSAEFATIAGEP